MFEPETAWAVWVMYENLEGKHLPNAGGLLDQDEQLMLDLSTISYASQLVEQMISARRGVPTQATNFGKATS